MNQCIFCKIRDKIIEKKLEYEDELVMVFEDIHPVKPTHLLIVPKQHVEDFLKLNDEKLINRLVEVTQKMILKENLEDKGYRVKINGGGAQIVNHLHLHLIGPMGEKV